MGPTFKRCFLATPVKVLLSPSDPDLRAAEDSAQEAPRSARPVGQVGRGHTLAQAPGFV